MTPYQKETLVTQFRRLWFANLNRTTPAEALAENELQILSLIQQELEAGHRLIEAFGRAATTFASATRPGLKVYRNDDIVGGKSKAQLTLVRG